MRTARRSAIREIVPPDTSGEADFLTCWQKFAPEGMPGPEREVMYAREIGRKFRADFGWPEARVLVEYEGGVTTGGAHGSVSGILRDIDRANAAAACGWLRFRVWRGMLDDWSQAMGFVQTVARVIANRLDHNDGL